MDLTCESMGRQMDKENVEDVCYVEYCSVMKKDETLLLHRGRCGGGWKEEWLDNGIRVTDTKVMML